MKHCCEVCCFPVLSKYHFYLLKGNSKLQIYLKYVLTLVKSHYHFMPLVKMSWVTVRIKGLEHQ